MSNVVSIMPRLGYIQSEPEDFGPELAEEDPLSPPPPDLTPEQVVIWRDGQTTGFHDCMRITDQPEPLRLA